jgi:hypothetical protein
MQESRNVASIMPEVITKTRLICNCRRESLEVISVKVDGMQRPAHIIMVVIGLLSLVALGSVAHKRLSIHSSDNHFVYQADAWLNGSLSLTRRPHHQNDWASHETLSLKGTSAKKYGPTVKGFFVNQSKLKHHFRTLQHQDIEIPKRDVASRDKHYYVSFPPGPAVLLMPFVWLFGYGVNDVLFTVIFGALNMMLVFMLVRLFGRCSHVDRTTSDQIWLAVFFTFSTCHFWLAVQGRVWFTALIVGSTFHLLYLIFAWNLKRPFWAGVCLALAFSSRATLLFSTCFIFWELWSARKSLEPRQLVHKSLLFVLPCLIGGSTLLLINWMRFDNPLEFGHTYLAGGNLQRIRDFGLFDPSFIGRNLSAMLTLLPRVSAEAPYLSISKHGMTVLLSSPALLLLLWRGSTTPIFWRSIIVAGILLVPILLYQNTGWEQFSFRFLMDILPLLMVAIAAKHQALDRVTKSLIVVGVLINLFGAITFQQPGFTRLYGEFLPVFWPF